MILGNFLELIYLEIYIRLVPMLRDFPKALWKLRLHTAFVGHESYSGVCNFMLTHEVIAFQISINKLNCGVRANLHPPESKSDKLQRAYVTLPQCKIQHFNEITLFFETASM